jgi:hypothetical protein
VSASIVSVSETVPVFFIQTFWVNVPPGLSVPALMAVQGMVQPLSVYTPTFTPAIVPFRGTLCDALSAAKVVTVNSTPIIEIATIAPVPSLFIAIVIPRYTKSCVLSVNKHYCPCEQRNYTSQLHKDNMAVQEKPSNRSTSFLGFFTYPRKNLERTTFNHKRIVVSECSAQEE